MTDAPTFSSLGLGEPLVKTLAALGYEAPTPIQSRTIPPLLAGRDLIGQAQTGTGKTAAFALPIVQKLVEGHRKPQALVLTPTRELAMQVAEAFHAYAPGAAVLPVYGGAPIVHQLKRLERGVQIVVGTPGRLIDVLDRGSLELDSVRSIVLDEADEMLKMGFIDDVEKILASAPSNCQKALFSATMPPEVLRIAQRHLANAERVEIEHRSVAAPAIEQRFLNVAESQKLEVLTQILELQESAATLIFRRTKNGAAELAERLEARGFGALAMHGDMKQSERESVIRRLRSGNVEIVVATDVAARGLDVEQIEHVINYDVPYDEEAYVHRIGRTGRAGRTGVATLFVTPRERRLLRDIEKFTGAPIKPMRLPTSADVVARRVGQLKDSIRKGLEQGDLDIYLELVEQLAAEGEHDIAEVAAAAARLSSTVRPIPAAQTAAEAGREVLDSPSRQESRGTDGATGSPSREGRLRRPRDDSRESDEGPRTRLVMSIGRREGIRPADVVGSIANEAGIPGRDIGPIEIGEEKTFVTVPAAVAEMVIAKVARAKFRGRPVNLRLARPEDGAAETGRRPSFARPRREFESSSAPRREGSASGPRRDRAPSSAPRRSHGSSSPPRREYGSSSAPHRGRDSAPRREGGPPRRKFGADARPERPGRAGGEKPFERRPPHAGAFSKFARRPKPPSDRGPKRPKR